MGLASFKTEYRSGTIERVWVSFEHGGERKHIAVRNCLSGGGTNYKLAKSDKVGRYRSWGLPLAPAGESGYQMCPKSTEGCRQSCIFTAGMAQIFPSVRLLRIARTLLFKEQPRLFEEMLRRDLSAVDKKCRLFGWKPVVRLNVFSDVPWEKRYRWIFEEYSNFRLYDYTKIVSRMFDKSRPSNYDLTFSLSETNAHEARKVLENGGRVAAVFGITPLRWRAERPKSLIVHGASFPVVDGDKHDLRFLDPAGVVVGLYAKGSGRQDRTGFVLRPDENGQFRAVAQRRRELQLANCG